MGDTPGWKVRNTDLIEIDDSRGIKLLRLKRTEPRMKQTSYTQLQSWRANCDVAILIYTQDPLKINAEDIAAISGYVTSYCTKGNATHPAEVQAISTMILSMNNDFAEGSTIGTVTACRKILNGFMTDRIISKAESSCDILRLPLYKCTEVFRSIPLSEYTKILGKKQYKRKKNTTNIVTRYASRTKDLTMNLNDYFHTVYKPIRQDKKEANRLLKEKMKSKHTIPHPTGLQNSPAFPIQWQYAKAALILYKPWNKNNRLLCDTSKKTKQSIILEYTNFLTAENCPDELKLEFAIAKETYERSLKKRECAHNDDNLIFEPGENMTKEAKAIIESQTVFRNQYEEFGFDRGLNYAWDIAKTEYDPELNDADWINCEKTNSESSDKKTKKLPTKPNNMNYTLEDIENSEEQSNVVYSVIAKIKEWIEFQQNKNRNPEIKFRPLFLTIQGAGGTGKSRTINVIVTIIEQIFPTEKVSVVSAPTGAAAYNIGGSTCHKQFAISVRNATKELSNKSKNQLSKTLKHILVMIIDERSLLSMEILGACERNARECCHGSINKLSEWGKIPVVLLFGDDYQLPSVVISGRGKGPSYIFDKNGKPDTQQKLNITEKIGFEQFLTLSEQVTELTISHRLEKDENELSSMLESMRTSKGLTKKQATKLLTYNIQNENISKERKEFLMKKAIWIFYTNAKVDTHNFTMMKSIVNEKNPVCNCMGYFSPAQGSNREVGNRTHFAYSELKKINSTICRGARVALDRNIWDNIGLYNGAMGTVIDIRFEHKNSPLQGDLPKYVIVDFDEYKGPPWDESNPSYLPIPPCSIRCRNGCCIFTKIPLTLSWARTAHKFQGSNVGSTYPIKAMVFDPGKSGVEGNNPGFTYVGLSRVSSLGQGTIEKSAFYLTGEDLTMERFTDMTYQRTRNNDMYVKVEARNRWIQHLLQQKIKTNLAIKPDTKKKLKTWTQTNTYTTLQLEQAILYHSKH